MKFLKFLAVLLLSLATPALAPTPAPAQHLASHGPPVAMPLVSTATAAVAIRAPAAPVLDGRDNDPAWEEAQVIQGFRMSDPIEDGAERFHTVARIAYDAHALYVLVRAFDPHPDSIVALLSRRDVSTPSDQIEVMIDSYHDRRTGYEFAVNPSGVQRDYAITNDGETDDSWDGIWQVATATDSLGWVAEFRIPFGQLRFGRSASHTFGLMIIRTIARTNERMSWPVLRRSRPGLASQFGEVSGITGLASPRRLDVVPYVAARDAARADTEGNITDYGTARQIEGGLDAKYRVSSNLTVDATVNPDFGQVEGDPSVVNLSGFETFLAERRPFFVEGSGILRFDLSCGDECNGLFDSRRIGRAPQLTWVDGYADANTPAATTILGAAKLTGHVERGLSVGLLDALTQQETGVDHRTVEPRTNYVVGRVQQDLRGGESGVGVMLTAVNRSLDEWSVDYLRRSAYTGGVDFRHRFLGRRFELRGCLAGSRVSGSAAAMALTQASSTHLFQRPDDGVRYDTTRTMLAGDAEQISFGKVGGGALRFNTSFSRLSPGFEINDAGFLQQTGRQSLGNWVGIRFDTPRAFYRQAQVNINAWESWTTQGMRSAGRVDMGVSADANAQFTNGWWAYAGAGVNNFASAYCDFCARGGPALRISPSMSAWAGVEGDARRALTPSLWVNTSRSDGGRSYSYSVSPSFSYLASSRLTASLGSDFAREMVDAQYVDQFGETGSDTAHYTFARLARTTLGITARADFTVSPALSLQLYAQPYVTSGRYDDWRELGRPRAAEYDDRFVPFAPDDGTVLSDYDFNSKSLQSTAVLRWEYQPGSTLFVVWTQGRQQDGLNPGTFRVGRDYQDLFAAHPENTFLIKASYRLSL